MVEIFQNPNDVSLTDIECTTRKGVEAEEGGPFPRKIRPSDLVIIVALINASPPHSLALFCCQVTFLFN